MTSVATHKSQNFLSSFVDAEELAQHKVLNLARKIVEWKIIYLIVCVWYIGAG